MMHTIWVSRNMFIFSFGAISIFLMIRKRTTKKVSFCIRLELSWCPRIPSDILLIYQKKNFSRNSFSPLWFVYYSAITKKPRTIFLKKREKNRKCKQEISGHIKVKTLLLIRIPSKLDMVTMFTKEKALYKAEALRAHTDHLFHGKWFLSPTFTQ